MREQAHCMRLPVAIFLIVNSALTLSADKFARACAHTVRRPFRGVGRGACDVQHILYTQSSKHV